MGKVPRILHVLANARSLRNLCDFCASTGHHNLIWLAAPDAGNHSQPLWAGVPNIWPVHCIPILFPPWIILILDANLANAWILMHTASLLPDSPPPSPPPSPPLIPSPFLARILCWAPGEVAHKKAWAGGTRGLPFLSVTDTPSPARTLDPSSRCAGLVLHSSPLGCC